MDQAIEITENMNPINVNQQDKHPNEINKVLNSDLCLRKYNLRIKSPFGS